MTLSPRDLRARLHAAFEIGVGLKIAFAAVETLAGAALWFIRDAWILGLGRWLTTAEISEDPPDRLASFIMHGAEAFSISAHQFWAVYLFGHGLIKLLALGAVVAGIRRAYPVAMLLMGGFVVWQITRFFHVHSPLMLVLSLFDLVVIWLIWEEYRMMPAAHAAPSDNAPDPRER